MKLKKWVEYTLSITTIINLLMGASETGSLAFKVVLIITLVIQLMLLEKYGTGCFFKE